MNPAKHYYDEFHRINPPKLGPYIDQRHLTKRMLRQLKSLDKEYFSLIVKDLSQCKMEIENGEIFVPSPWHAWALLSILFHKINDQIPFDSVAPIHIKMLVYRGQSNAHLDPIPSLYRPNTNRELEIDSLNAFTFIFNQDFIWQKLEISPSIHGAKAAAQHYGIKTDLLDITANPAVAVHFASRSKNRKRGDLAAVFVYDLNAFSLSEVKLILPPPFVDRLYLQRGGFFEIKENETSLIRDKCFKITFPFDPNYKLYDYEYSDNILLENEWLNNVVYWSKEMATSNKKLPTLQTEVDHLLIDVFEKIGYPNIGNQSPLEMFQKFEELLYWYAIRIQGNQEALLPYICDNISRNNTDLIRFLIKYYDIEIKFLELNNYPIKDIEYKKNYNTSGLILLI